jgi:hypothetical protein
VICCRYAGSSGAHVVSSKTATRLLMRDRDLPWFRVGVMTSCAAGRKSRSEMYLAAPRPNRDVTSPRVGLTTTRSARIRTVVGEEGRRGDA